MELKKLQQAHLAAWNEKDRVKRDELLKSIYADDIKMYDKNFILNGTTEISDFIQKLQADPKFFFSSTDDIEDLQDSARLFGQIITSEGTLKSMDFFILENGKAKHYYAFMSPE
ncbi:nuclear transport factor 2 family protein [Flavobacterium sp. NRK1]|uniref:nuclear transport factor 2 family protein n=1 Tax=Flavobacterium sp. NRK1 TaxID=2954929 RepID=UPI002093B332|nr:nuclear transport factor 2 family protein [Flavobacterium sp. NRK1]MCO6148657.1 nuclear transport factor 2 family protein [Flavobacterium sp. NRK1]